MTSDAPRSVPVRVLVGLARLVWTLVVVLVPLAGIWIASSLAAFGNGPVWLAILAGALAFPLIPLAWELLSGLLRRRAKARGPKRLADLRSRGETSRPYDERILTVWDRLVLRTLIVNLLFVGGLLWSRPATVYEAVSARGDWMLDEVEAPWADRIRAGLHDAAERFEWLHQRTHANEYAELVDDAYSSDAIRPTPPPTVARRPGPVADPGIPADPTAPADPGADPAPGPAPAANDPASAPQFSYEHWPQPNQPHPLIVDMPAAAERSIASIAAYVVEHEPDPRQRVKALHDWVATRIRYDIEAAESGLIPTQDADSVFATRTSVCAGYANLLAALITEAGGHAVVVLGDARGQGIDLSGEGHAWNAVELDGAWTLIDATWDAGSSTHTPAGAKVWEFRYSTDYLFVPPEIIGLTHFPDQPDWQLRTEPLARGDFLRQPVLRPRLFAQGFDLISPRRSQISVSDSVELELANHQGRFVIAHVRARNGPKHDCEVYGRSKLTVSCTLPGEGQYELELFANDEQYGSFQYIASMMVNASG